MELSLFCPSEAGVIGPCAEWAQLYHLQHSTEDCGPVPAGRKEEILKEPKAIKITQSILFPV